MLLKLKTCLTVVTLYEIVAVILLHCPRVCDAMFGVGFCDDHVFKYFIACFAIPALVLLAIMWISEIVHGARRRHSFTYRAKTAVMDVVENVREKVSEHVSAKDVEKLITVALLMGIKKYVHNHPQMRRKINEMMGHDAAEYEYDYDNMDTEYDPNDDERSSRDSRAATSRDSRRKTTTATTRRSTRTQSRKK